METSPHADRNRNAFTLSALSSAVGRERQRVTRGLSARENDSCDHFVLITENKPRSLFIKGEPVHQCPLTKKVMAVRMVMTTTIPRMTSRMRFWMILRNIPVRIRELFPKFASVSRSRSRARCIFSLS